MRATQNRHSHFDSRSSIEMVLTQMGVRCNLIGFDSSPFLDSSRFDSMVPLHLPREATRLHRPRLPHPLLGLPATITIATIANRQPPPPPYLQRFSMIDCRVSVHHQAAPPTQPPTSPPAAAPAAAASPPPRAKSSTWFITPSSPVLLQTSMSE